MTTLAVNPHAADGWVAKYDYTSFAGARSAPTGDYVNTALTYASLLATGYYDDTDVTFSLTRMFMAFDTSAIEGDVSSASLRVYAKKEQASVTQEGIALVASTAASATATVVADFDALGSTLLAPALLHADIGTAAGAETFTLNAAGLAALNNAGYTKLALRENHYDLGGTNITIAESFVTYGDNFTIYTQNHATTSYRPLLTIEYTASGTSYTKAVGLVAGIVASTLRSTGKKLTVSSTVVRSLTVGHIFTKAVSVIADIQLFGRG